MDLQMIVANRRKPMITCGPLICNVGRTAGFLKSVMRPGSRKSNSGWL